MDWHQLWQISSAPDNVPIVILLFLTPFYLWYGFREAIKNDRLITQLEADPALAKTHHRKHQPYHPAWDKTVHVWPYLLRIELLAALVVTAFLCVWAVYLDAPLEEPANPTLTMNPAKAPWYFLGLQEMLVYFDPWIAGVVLPNVIVVGLMAIPYMDTSPLGNGYYTWKQRKFAIGGFMFGYLVLWLALAVVGTFIRGPGWMWFWPGQTWDAHRVVHEVNIHLHELFGITDVWEIAIFGGIATLGFTAVLGGMVDFALRKWKPELFRKMNLIQYLHLIGFLVCMIWLPVKMILKLGFDIKYVWVTPWFNV
jgi:hypothetical protein